MRDRKARQAQVRNVGYLREYGELPHELGVSTLGNMSDEELVSLAEQIGMKKRPATGKSDIYMNDLGYMLISGVQQSTLVDGAPIEELIELAEQLQLVEVGRELVNSTNSLEGIELPRNDEAMRKQWAKLVSHWMCQGDVASPSRFPADLILCYQNPLNMNTWDIYEPEAYIEAIWKQLEVQIDEEQRVLISVGVRSDRNDA